MELCKYETSRAAVALCLYEQKQSPAAMNSSGTFPHEPNDARLLYLYLCELNSQVPSIISAAVCSCGCVVIKLFSNTAFCGITSHEGVSLVL